MFNVKFMVWSMLFLIWQSGCSIDPKPQVPKPPTEVNSSMVGIGLEKGKVELYNSSPKGQYYYGQVRITPTLTIHALKGPESQTFLSHVKNLFREKKENFGLSVTPIMDGHRLPDIVLFVYNYDSQTKQWSTYLNEEPTTGMILLNPDTELSFELKYISIDRTTFQQIENITKSIYGESFLFVNTYFDYIGLLSDNISRMLNSSISSSTVLYFRPVSNKKKSVEYNIKTKSNQLLAKVKFSLIFRDSVVSGNIVSDNLDAIPKIDTFSGNPLNAVKISPNNNLRLYDLLQKDVNIATFAQIDDPSTFKTKCSNILNQLETYGLNISDQYNSFIHLLEETNFFQKDKLYHSSCLSHRDMALLNKMGVELTPPKSPSIHIDIPDKKLEKLGSYMLNPIANKGFQSDLLKMFTETVIVRGAELISVENLNIEDGESVFTPKEFMQHLGAIGVARFGKYNVNRAEYARFYFRPLNSSTIYRIKLDREKKWGRIRTVTIDPWEDKYLSKVELDKLRTPADKEVLNFESDVLAKEEVAITN